MTLLTIVMSVGVMFAIQNYGMVAPIYALRRAGVVTTLRRHSGPSTISNPKELHPEHYGDCDVEVKALKDCDPATRRGPVDHLMISREPCRLRWCIASLGEASCADLRLNGGLC